MIIKLIKSRKDVSEGPWLGTKRESERNTVKTREGQL